MPGWGGVGDNGSTGGGLLGAGQVVFLDLGAGDMGVISL